MKKFFLLISLAFIITSCGNNSSDNSSTEKTEKKSIVLKGSDTVLPLAQKEAEEFMKKDTTASLTVTGGGSGVGFTALIDGTTDIAMASREIKLDEKTKLETKSVTVKEVLIAKDALAVIVNPANKIAQLTKEQLKDIFTGKITNWKQVGGDNEKIVVYARETSSGTYEFFKEHVMDKINYDKSVLNLPATGAIVQSVSQTKGAIGYIGLAYLNSDVKDVAVSYDEGKTYINASTENAINGTYPITRPLFFYYDESIDKKVKSFVDYVLSAEGQTLVKEVGYVPLK
ncbi:MAG: PstS family phosphate ABC transporter substrate-binding protein [Bacteroidota bacterium]